MRISGIYTRRFAKEEYDGFSNSEIDGEDLLILGGNRTGKTLTFNSLLYNLFGPTHTIDLSTGHGNDVTIEFDDEMRFKRGQPENILTVGGEELSSQEAENKLHEKLGEDLTNDLPLSTLIKSHFLHTHPNRLPLSSLSKQQRLAIARGVVDKSKQQDIESKEQELEDLHDELHSTRESLRRSREDRQEVENQLNSAKNQLKKYQNISTLLESGELAEISENLQANEEIQRSLEEEFKKKESNRQRLRQKSKLKNRWEKYKDNEKKTIIAQAVNDFVCPACSDRVPVELAETRLSSSRCPFCAVEGRGNDLDTDVEHKVQRAQSEVDELVEEIESIKRDVEEIDERIENLKSQQPGLEEVTSFVERKLREHDFDLAPLEEEVEIQVEKNQSTVNEAESLLESVVTGIQSDEESIEYLQESIDETQKKIVELREESIEKEISEFSQRWENIFQSAAGEIGLNIRLTEQGDVEIPGNEGPRSYDTAGDLSDAEIWFLNISFVVTINRFARENGLINWSVIVLDEPFSSLDSDGRKELLEFIEDADEQFICTSSEEALKSHFPMFGELTRQTIQASLGRFSE